MATRDVAHHPPPTSAHNWAVLLSQTQLPAMDGLEPIQPPEDPARPVQTAAETIVDLLCQHGLTTFFGVPGGPVIPVFDAILRHRRARLIEPRHETYGTFAAMGFYRATGQAPVVVVTAGPGSTNVVTGVVSAHLERVPMVVICGDVPWSQTGHRMLQDTGPGGVGIERMLTGVSRYVVRVAHPASASSQVRAAIEAALDPHNPGPAVVVISIDRAGGRADPPQLFSPRPDRPRQVAAPEPALVSQVASTLRSAERPLLVIGAGCRGEAKRVLRLCEAVGAPFCTTPQAKGILPEDHPLSLRSCGMGGSLWARRYMRAGVDVALVLGTDLDDISTLGAPLLGRFGTLIHVDTDPTVFARNHPTALAAMYDVGAFSEALAQQVSKWGRPLDGGALAAEARAVSPFDVPEFAQDEAVPLAPHRAIADLERAAGPTASFLTDIGEHMIFALHYLTIRSGQRFTIHLGLGSMGSGISSIIGQAVGEPTRRHICICGDGGMQMAGMEILVAIKLRLPVIYAVFNDARYNMVYHGYRITFGREQSWDTPPVDFVKWAEAVGARGARIERPGQITTELLDQLTAGGVPAVLDIRYDADVRVKGSGRAEAITEMAKLST
ncbi:MAG: thiamine pyrophosphate-binding protein [Myxococcales bacterium]|nr:thiamine pyrophosphate-binding protein [Myxococcota bacterium]MDW8280379.1 thiamine pyrophosphate-binding protein [Myxococcales bacterium]